MIPTTPSEVHGRVYTRAIQPLATAESAEDLGDLLSDVMGSLMIPADMVNYPTTFGPEDDDPLYALFQLTKKQDTKVLKESISVNQGREKLKAVYDQMKRADARSIADRFTAEEEDPYPVYSRPLETVLSVKAMREAKEIADAVRLPLSVKSLFLPNSRHFLSGYLSVEPFIPDHVKPDDALKLNWHGSEGDNGCRATVARLMDKTTKKDLAAVWERWDALADELSEEHTILLSPPLFPLPTAGPWSYNDGAELVAGSDQAAIAPAREDTATPNALIKRTVEDNQGVHGLDPLARHMLDEFDGNFEQLSPSSRAQTIRSEPPPLSLGPALCIDPLDDDENMTSWRHSDASRPKVEPSNNEWSESDEATPRKRIREWTSTNHGYPPFHVDQSAWGPHSLGSDFHHGYNHSAEWSQDGTQDVNVLDGEDVEDRMGSAEYDIFDYESYYEVPEEPAHTSYPSEGTTVYPPSDDDDEPPSGRFRSEPKSPYTSEASRSYTNQPHSTPQQNNRNYPAYSHHQAFAPRLPQMPVSHLRSLPVGPAARHVPPNHYSESVRSHISDSQPINYPSAPALDNPWAQFAPQAPSHPVPPPQQPAQGLGVPRQQPGVIMPSARPVLVPETLEPTMPTGVNGTRAASTPMASPLRSYQVQVPDVSSPSPNKPVSVQNPSPSRSHQSAAAATVASTHLPTPPGSSVPSLTSPASHTSRASQSALPAPPSPWGRLARGSGAPVGPRF